MDRLPVVTFANGTPPVPAAAPPPVAFAPPPMPAQSDPIPAQAVLEATPIVTRPRDALTKAATDSAQITTASAATTGAGHEGGYQLQVSSFKSQQEAEGFAEQLRARGHKAYTEEARVAGRGTWWRVRVGPFSTQHAAAAYRVSFEAKEHVVPFLVTPPKHADHAE
jgi:cell division septation protein DedD